MVFGRLVATISYLGVLIARICADVMLTYFIIGEIGTACGGAPTPTPPAPIVPGPTPPGPTPSPPTECTGKCASASWKGDKYCDDGNNNCGCKWDGGDCCGPDVKKNYCKECKCLEPTKKPKPTEKPKPKPKPTPPPCNDKCGNQGWKGDGYCDDVNNNCGCAWDGGDCCGANVRKHYCNKCECLDPKA